MRMQITDSPCFSRECPVAREEGDHSLITPYLDDENRLDQAGDARIDHTAGNLDHDSSNDCEFSTRGCDDTRSTG